MDAVSAMNLDLKFRRFAKVWPCFKREMGVVAASYLSLPSLCSVFLLDAISATSPVFDHKLVIAHREVVLLPGDSASQVRGN